MTPLQALKHHVTGAIERGEKQANHPNRGKRVPDDDAAQDVAVATFEAAIASGRLSGAYTHPLYAGNFMFMGFRDGDGRAQFKNINTREYLP